MRAHTWTLLTCLSALACSGKYEVGTEAMAGAGKSNKPTNVGETSSAGNANGGTSSAGEGGPSATGGTLVSAGTASIPATGNISTGCGVAERLPEPLEAPLTATTVWWSRLQHVMWGAPHDAPLPFPTTLSAEELPRYVDTALDDATVMDGQMPIGEAFLRYWAQLEQRDGETLPPWGMDWMVLLADGRPALDVLLTQRYDGQRIGVFSEQSFLTRYPNISHRGTSMVSALFNQQVPREPEGVVHLPPPAGMTRREALAASIVSPSCAGCHQFIDPLGYALENFDDVGAYRTTDAGKPVDTSGSYQEPSGNVIDFDGISDLGAKLKTSCAANLGFSDQFLSYALQASGSANFEQGFALDQERVRQAYLNGGRNLRSLIHAYAEGQAIRLP